MKNKKIIFLFFALAIILVPVYMIVSSEDVLNNGTFYKFRPQARDPFDPFRGKYLRINYDTNSIPTKEKLKRGDKVYVSIGVDEKGFAYFKEAFLKAPKKGDYLPANVRYADDFRGRGRRVEAALVDSEEPMNYISIKPPNNMCKYFINEDYAQAAEDAYFKEWKNAYIGVRILDGSARVQDIYLKGKPIMDYLKNK